ncbi:MAG: hypothetical protein HQL21_01760 [Candidatus Omnitrophica bacterium]|nr:hypothetical protein [Candidatus Omnitrophota bacterium]
MRLRISLFISLVLSSTILFSGPSWCASESILNPTESLVSLPYLGHVAIENSPEKAGTTIYKKDKAFSGYSIYTSYEGLDVFANLIDMDGRLVHRWVRNPQDSTLRWKQAIPFPDGSIFLTNEQRPVGWELVDANSHSIITYDIPRHSAHHAAYWLKEGGFLGLTSNTIRIRSQGLRFKAYDNSLVWVSSEGAILKMISLSKLFREDGGYQEKLKEAHDYLKDYQRKSSQDKAKRPIFDFFHSNTIVRLEWDIPGVLKKGAWLVTVRNLNRIIVVDPVKEEIIWQWGENIISHPHDASFLKGGKILLFDNGVSKHFSRVIVVDIRSKQIVWQYGQKPGQEFFTAERGSVQRLPNGNTLINESNKGRAFEVMDSGEVVWEWYADFRTQGQNKGKRRVVGRIERLPYNFFEGVEFNYGVIKR